VKPRRFDATDFLTVWLVLLFAIPANLIFKPLGASGTPANVVGIVGFIWWMHAKMVGRLTIARGRQPVRIALLLFGCAILASVVALYLRPFDPKEASGDNRGLLVFVGAAGITLLIADGVQSLERLNALLRRFVVAATAMALVGVPQFVTGLDIAKSIKVPGLHPNTDIEPWGQRGHFRRVQSTSSHPIEFGVVLALAFPIALHYAMTSPKRQRKWWIGCTIVCAFGVAMSLSRSGFVALIAASIMMFASWSWRLRGRALTVAVGFLAITRLTIHGLVGTLIALFTHISQDPSTTGRTARYGIAGHYVKLAPWTGRGFFTFIPSLYMIFDNQYLLTVVEMGFVGLVALLAMLFIGIFTARGARRLTSDPDLKNLAQTLAACILAGLLTLATFDALSFPMATAVLFFLLGASGALWRLSREGALVGSAPPSIGQAPMSVAPA
jgi:O-antigen ligase